MKSKKGFTLVELAIVLVIIGLLVGGVLAGQELIEQAKIRKVLAEYQDISRAVGTYMSKYGKLPGDDNKAADRWGTVGGACGSFVGTGTQTCNGDGNGIIGSFWNGQSVHEQYRFFQHLTLAGLLSGSYSGVWTQTCVGTDYCQDTTNSPPSIIEGATWSAVACVSPMHAGCGQYTGNIITLTNASNYNGQFWGRSIYAHQMASLDTKFDDGKPIRGALRSMQFDNGLCFVGANGGPWEEYDVTNVNIGCTPRFKLSY